MSATDHSIWSLVMEASLLVKGVMLTLLLASIATWFLIAQRGRLFAQAQAALKQFENQFWSGTELAQLYRLEGSAPGVEQIFRAGFKEYTQLNQRGNGEPEAVMQGVQRAMRVAISREEERLDRHLPFLATVGSVSPYIGLFGTVWGILNSFASIATLKSASLAVVAPGIAEALLATALGLFAAIPAVMIFNKFARDINGFVGALDNFSAEMIASVSRQLDEGR